MVVASPSYLVPHGEPKHPRELVHHRCIGSRPAPNVAPYRWEFEENGIPFDVAVDPQITTNDLRLMLRTALAGGRITFAPEETFRPFVETDQLVPLLKEFISTPFPGIFPVFLAAPQHGSKVASPDRPYSTVRLTFASRSRSMIASQKFAYSAPEGSVNCCSGIAGPE
jgi:DNA-binding transcriptional LysR family regulator